VQHVCLSVKCKHALKLFVLCNGNDVPWQNIITIFLWDGCIAGGWNANGVGNGNRILPNLTISQKLHKTEDTAKLATANKKP